MEVLYIGRPITSYIKPTLDNVLFSMTTPSTNVDISRLITSFREMDIAYKQDEYYPDRSTFEADFLNLSEYFRSFIMLNVDRGN